MYNREKRGEELQLLLNKFQEKCKANKIEFTYKENALSTILDNYQFLLNERVKAVHESNTNVNIYKIASGTEIAITCSRPIIAKTVTLTDFLIASLAYEVAFAMILSKNLDLDNYTLTDFEEEILSEHFELLLYNPTESLLDSIVMTNSLFWKALYCSVFQRIGSSQ